MGNKKGIHKVDNLVQIGTKIESLEGILRGT